MYRSPCRRFSGLQRRLRAMRGVCALGFEGYNIAQERADAIGVNLLFAMADSKGAFDHLCYIVFYSAAAKRVICVANEIRCLCFFSYFNSGK